MPAISADTVALPRVPDPDPTAVDRPVVSVTTAPSGFEGEGFPVRRAFAGVDLAALDPFVHMDQMGEIDYAPGEPKGTPWHPHRGFETVTYMIDGVFRHQDSNGGGGGLITDGDTQWMTAGGGLSLALITLLTSTGVAPFPWTRWLGGGCCWVVVFVGSGWLVVEGRVATLAVVEDLDEIEDRRPQS